MVWFSRRNSATRGGTSCVVVGSGICLLGLLSPPARRTSGWLLGAEPILLHPSLPRPHGDRYIRSRAHASASGRSLMNEPSEAIPVVNFGAGADFALGVEEELVLVDPETHALDHGAFEVLGRLHVPSDEGGIHPEGDAAGVE